MGLISRYALILTHNRPALVAQCVESIARDVDRVYVIDNASMPPLHLATAIVLRDEEQPPNLARLWNRGFDVIAEMARLTELVQWDIAVLCDDAILPPGWFDNVSSTMRSAGAIAGATHGIAPIETPILKLQPDGDIYNRMPGWAFVVAGEHGLRADENLKWWWCDTDIDWQARCAGGTIIAPGPIATNALPNDFTYSVPGLSERAGVDGENFRAKWGWRPW